MRMLLGLSESLPSLVEAKFNAAKAAQSLIFSPTELAIIRTSTGIPFQLRYCPALAKKPVPGKDDASAPKKKPDPFHNPSADLLIADIPTLNPSHLLVLNKFPVIRDHFILATKTNKEQTHVLEQDDLEATYACLKAWQNNMEQGHQKRLFAFFNSGEHSGASQPHRHLQFLPVECMKEGKQSKGWDLLIDIISSQSDTSLKHGVGWPSGLLQHPAIPFAHFALRLPSEPSGPQLLLAYDQLYQSAKKAVEEYIETNPSTLALHPIEEGSLPISYNMAMTTTAIAICPRRSEGHTLRHDDGSEIGLIALNGTTLGGTLMVKNQEEWDVLRTQSGRLDSILEAIGIPKEVHPPTLHSRV
ncbi:Ap4A phosphorylase-like protein II [Lindgomyces ingoldianus]|uniref:Ap4A phosphorylase-like protein II n=1 Tax=Lindgomyces ingoldianus TaxID=673940 RepID=A0ACB6QM50_9PLEO|nr:Ap4A phosphorylase-like protein II [Lindgomyces ingoldianus]KAF2467226.1 Ap4A phosphorylase-like protein II [Lindgomyces ingoldianus]